MNAKYFAMALGVIYIIVGIAGFIPGLLMEPNLAAPDVSLTTGYGNLFGLFPVNILHTLVHLGVGVWGVAASRRPGAARKFAQSVAVIFAVLTIFGLIPGLKTLFGLIPLHGHDVWLHALTAIVAAYFGFRSSARDKYIDAGTVAK
jgi:hypothetical protein